MNTVVQTSVSLSSAQQLVMQQIIDYGLSQGFSVGDIQIAVKVAFMESSLASISTPPPATNG